MKATKSTRMESETKKSKIQMAQHILEKFKSKKMIRETSQKTQELARWLLRWEETTRMCLSSDSVSRKLIID